MSTKFKKNDIVVVDNYIYIDGTNESVFLDSLIGKKLIVSEITNEYNDTSIPTYILNDFETNNTICKNNIPFPFVDADLTLAQN